MFLEYYFYYFYYLMLGYPFIIRLAVVVIAFLFIPLFIVSCSRLAQLRKTHYQKRKLQKKCRAEHYDKIIEIITSEKHYTAQQINAVMNCNIGKLSAKQKRVLTNQILKAHDSNLPDINKANYRRLVEYFDLLEFWEKKLKYGSLASRHKALRKLDDLDIEVPGSVITQLTHNRNKDLRKRARSYYTYFSKTSPFKFLEEDYDKAFNDWDKIEIHRVLKKKEEHGLPLINQWLRNSKNTSFRCFLIDEIIHFNQKSCCPYLRKLLKTEDLKLRKHCIDALGIMRCFDSEQDLMNDYSMQPVIIQRSIVKALQRICSGKALPFLEEAYLSAHDTETRIVILNSIYNYGEAGKKLFYALKNSEAATSELVFEHVSNPLIKIY